MRQIWDDSRIKRKMDRLSNARAMGVEDALKDGNDEMPGDINVKGDETHYHYAPPAAAQPATQPTGSITAPATTAKASWLPLAAACIGLPLLGAGGMWLCNHQSSPATAITQPLNNLGIKPGVQVTDKP